MTNKKFLVSPTEGRHAGRTLAVHVREIKRVAFDSNDIFTTFECWCVDFGNSNEFACCEHANAIPRFMAQIGIMNWEVSDG